MKTSFFNFALSMGVKVLAADKVIFINTLFKRASILDKSLRPLLHSGGRPSRLRRDRQQKRDFTLNNPLLHCSQNSATHLTNTDTVAVLSSPVAGRGCSALWRCTILRLVISEPVTVKQLNMCALWRSVLYQKINLKTSRLPMSCW